MTVLGDWYEGLPRDLTDFGDHSRDPLGVTGRALAGVVASCRRYYDFLGPGVPRAFSTLSADETPSGARARLAMLGYLNAVRCSRVAFVPDAVEAERQWLPWLEENGAHLDECGRRTTALALAALRFGGQARPRRSSGTLVGVKEVDTWLERLGGEGPSDDAWRLLLTGFPGLLGARRFGWVDLFWGARAQLSGKRGHAIADVTSRLGTMFGLRIATRPPGTEEVCPGAVKDLLEFMKKT